MPFYGPYAATKGAVKLFSEVMRRELKDFPIQVATLYPTGTDTPMMKTANTGKLQSPEMVAQRAIEGLRSGDIDIIFAMNRMWNWTASTRSSLTKNPPLWTMPWQKGQPRTVQCRAPAILPLFSSNFLPIPVYLASHCCCSWAIAKTKSSGIKA